MSGLRSYVAGVCLLSLLTVESIGPGLAQQQAQPMPAWLPAGSVTYPVHFATGQFAVVKEDADTVRAVASKMKNDPHLEAILVGKADTVGSTELNEHLAQKRAEAVFEALVYTNGVPESQVQIRFTGERVPVAATADEQTEAQNRMVAIVVH
jgi:outer membrane protein OmpA-like peptidoglycan-associated protein